MRRAAKTDANHGAVRDYLRAKGWSVHSTAALGNGFPDLVVARRGFTALLEVKDGSLWASRQRPNPAQAKFASAWHGVCITAKSPEDAETQLDLAERYQLMQATRFV